MMLFTPWEREVTKAVSWAMSTDSGDFIVAK
jgi:hypothetical protein